MNFDGQNLTDWLEGKDVTDVPQSVDLSVLDEAQKYNIDLSALEKISSPKKKLNNSNKPATQITQWSQLDIKLNDVVDLVFDKSDFPVFIVQDDEIIYANRMVSDLLQLDNWFSSKKHKFLELVYKEDWNLLANNIGEMLTNHKELIIRFMRKDGKIQELKLKAIYLPDIEHFSFVLLGEKIRNKNKINSNMLYDDETGLPSFFLFEDRTQMAILRVNSAPKEDGQALAVLAINIDNIADFKKMNLDDMIIKKLADNLVFNLPKIITISRGLKYHFWILLNGLQKGYAWDYYMLKIREVLDAGISDNFVRHELAYSIGGSIFGRDARSAKELVAHAIEAVRKAQNDSGNSLVIYEVE